MTDPGTTARTAAPVKGSVLAGAALGVLATIGFLAFSLLETRPALRELQDPEVTVVRMDCGEAASPPGVEMPAQPGPGALSLERRYTRQRWQPGAGLVIEAWQFLKPDQVLTDLYREVNGTQITLRPKWSKPAMLLVCHSKTGIFVRFPQLPNQAYTVIVAPPLNAGR